MDEEDGRDGDGVGADPVTEACERDLLVLMHERRPWTSRQAWTQVRPLICRYLQCRFKQECLDDFAGQISRHDLASFRIPIDPMSVKKSKIRARTTWPVIIAIDTNDTNDNGGAGLRTFLYAEPKMSHAIVLGVFLLPMHLQEDDCPVDIGSIVFIGAPIPVPTGVTVIVDGSEDVSSKIWTIVAPYMSGQNQDAVLKAVQDCVSRSVTPLLEHIKELEAKLAATERSKTESKVTETKITEINKQLEEKRKEVTDLKLDNQKLQKQIERNTEISKAAEGKTSDCANQLAEANKKLAELKTQISANVSTTAQLQAQKNKACDDIKKIQNTIAAQLETMSLDLKRRDCPSDTKGGAGPTSGGKAPLSKPLSRRGGAGASGASVGGQAIDGSHVAANRQQIAYMTPRYRTVIRPSFRTAGAYTANLPYNPYAAEPVTSNNGTDGANSARNGGNQPLSPIPCPVRLPSSWQQ
jgi:hypothetical protein